MTRPKVLTVSYDETVAKMRTATLYEAGYDVTSFTAPAEALAVQPTHFDLVVIGHRFDLKAKETLINKARSDWKSKVILVCGASNDPEIHPDARVYGLEGVQGIVDAAQKLVPVPALAQ